MARIAPGWLVAVTAVLLLPGCRWPWRGGPGSKSLADCRRLMQQGLAAAEREQHRQAESLLAEAVDTCPSDPDARRHYAETLWERGARPDAIAQLEEALRLDPEDASLHARLAEMYLETGRADRARRHAEQALDLNPGRSAAWAIRGRVMRAVDHPQQALADYHRALANAPDDQQILLEMAELYRQLNRPRRALATLHRLADTYSPGEEPQQVLYLTGLAQMALGRYEDAVDSLSSAIVRDRPTPELFYRLGEAELLAGRPGRATAAAQQALALAPDHGPSRNLLGRLRMARQPRAPSRR